MLTATRKAVTSVPLIPGLKALVARNTGDAAGEHPPAAPEADRGAGGGLFAAFDASGVTLAKAA